MNDNYLISSIQAIVSLRSPRQIALEREAEAIKSACEVAVITGTFPQIKGIPYYSQTPEVQAEQKIFEQRVKSLVNKVVTTSREVQEAEADLFFGRQSLVYPTDS